jgi:GGDEF domain-containing protein
MAPEDEVDLTREELRRRVEELDGLLRLRDMEIETLRLQLATLATVDPDTGLLNRNGIVEAIDTALQRHDRLEERFAVVVVGLRHASRRLREADPEEIRHVSALLQASIRALDRAGRLDETTFAVVLNLTGVAEPMAPVDRILAALRGASIVEPPGEEPDLRVGLVLARQARTPTLDEVLTAISETLVRAGPGSPATSNI